MTTICLVSRKCFPLIIIIIFLTHMGLVVSSGSRVAKAQTPAIARVFINPSWFGLTEEKCVSIMLDAKTYPISFADIDLTFDPTKIYLTQEIQETNLLGTDIIKTSKDEANASGHMAIVLGLSYRQIPPTGIFEVAKICIDVSTTDKNIHTSIDIIDEKCELVHIGEEHVPFTSNNASIMINSITQYFYFPIVQGKTTLDIP